MSDSTTAFLTSKSPPSEARLAGGVRRVAALAERDRRDMHALLSTYFAGVAREQFDRDLDEKEWVVVLEDAESGELRGFSTLMRIETTVGGERAVVLFSGDTIVRHDCWGETVLPRVWSRHAFRVAAAERETRVFWYLICSGYKTYRFLPVFFREFFPRYDSPTPADARSLLDAVGREKFGPRYDVERGVVRLDGALRPGVADVTDARLRDPHVAFFCEANPGHERGDELACLTELTPSNLTRAGRRMVGEVLSAEC